MSGIVRVWRCDLDRTNASLDPLDASERKRAAAFAFEHLRRHYIGAHCFLRAVLADALGTSPAALVFDTAPHGKPHLSDRALAFNLSHSDSVAYVAIAEGGELGIDVERHRRIEDLMSVARSVFSPAEMAELQDAAVGERTAMFLRCWTRKEAYVKALGVGLGAQLREITVTPRAADIELLHTPSASDSAFHIRSLEYVADEYVALATSVPPRRIDYQAFT